MEARGRLLHLSDDEHEILGKHEIDNPVDLNRLRANLPALWGRFLLAASKLKVEAHFLNEHPASGPSNSLADERIVMEQRRETLTQLTGEVTVFMAEKILGIERTEDV